MEGRISLDSISTMVGDARFSPLNGMRIPIEIYFHDNDGGELAEGRVGISPYNNNNAYQTPEAWTYTWIGNQFTTVSVDNDDGLLVDQFILYPNFPNPFNPSTTIQFSLNKDQLVSLNIYNLKGQLVETIINKKLKMGSHSVDWNASKHASGMYIYQLQSIDNSVSQKMVLMK